MALGIGLLSGCSGKKEETKAAAPGGAFPVSAVKVEAADVPLTGDWVGTMDGNVNAQIQPQVSGYL
ncbi:MAG TPA: efflux transporter periplasmic adaptor subunit, partial [Edaphobacter sp.]